MYSPPHMKRNKSSFVNLVHCPVPSLTYDHFSTLVRCFRDPSRNPHVLCVCCCNTHKFQCSSTTVFPICFTGITFFPLFCLLTPLPVTKFSSNINPYLWNNTLLYHNPRWSYLPTNRPIGIVRFTTHKHTPPCVLLVSL